MASAEDAVQSMQTARHRIHWATGARRASGAEIELIEASRASLSISLTPLLTFHVAGIGYHHPEWGHGVWKGEEVIAAESWTVADLDPLTSQNIYVHQMVRATLSDCIGYGTLETLCSGRHEPSVFWGFLDGAL